MAKLTVAVKPAPKMSKGAEQYISRTFLSGTDAPTADPKTFAGRKAKVFRIVSHDSRRHTILYLEDVDPNGVL